MAARKLTVYLPPNLDAKVRKVARDQHRSESSIVLEALKARLERGDASNAIIEESARRQLSRVDARLEKVIGESLILKEIVLLFVRVWLEHNPPIEEHLEEAAAASAEARFERFLDFVAQALAPGKSLGAAFSLESAQAGAVVDHIEEARA
jgi:predicted transcriptional regulator